MSAAPRLCVRCNQPLGEGLFCQFDGVYVLDPEGTVVMAGRGERLLSWLVSGLIFIFTLGIGIPAFLEIKRCQAVARPDACRRIIHCPIKKAHFIRPILVILPG